MTLPNSCNILLSETKKILVGKKPHHYNCQGIGHTKVFVLSKVISVSFPPHQKGVWQGRANLALLLRSWLKISCWSPWDSFKPGSISVPHTCANSSPTSAQTAAAESPNHSGENTFHSSIPSPSQMGSSWGRCSPGLMRNTTKSAIKIIS